MGLTKISGDVIQTPLNVGVVTATGVNVGTAVTIHTSGFQIGSSDIHSTGISVRNVNSTGVVTATSFVGNVTGNITGNVNSTGVSTFATLRVGTGVTISGGIVSATSFSGDGSALTGIAGTANVITNSLVVSGVTTVAAGSSSIPSISPTGDSNTGIFFPSADTVSIGEGGVEALRINDRGQILLGVSGFAAATSPTASYTQYTPLHLIGGTGTNNGSSIFIARNQAASASSNQDLGAVIWGTNDGAPFARIASFVDGNSTGSSYPGYLTFQTTASGGTTPTERLRIDSKGHLGINGTAPSDQFLLVSMNSGSTETAGIAVTVSQGAYPGTSNQKAGYFYNAAYSANGGFSSGVYAESNNPSYGNSYAVYAKSAGFTYGEAAALYAITNHPNPGGPGTNYGAIIKTSASSTGSPLGGIYGLYIENNAGAGTVSESRGLQVNTASGPGSVIPIIAYHANSQIFQVKSNGGINNYSGNNTNLSDERKKKNIETLDSTWNCLKNWELKKFHFKDQDDTENKHYGVIAQQIQPHCPEVISEWVEQQEKPEGYDIDGNVIQEAQEKISWLSIQEQKMTWMAIKALQEAQERIETLEAQNAALTARLDAAGL